MAVGEGARQSIMNEIGKLGNTTLEIRPGTGWGSKRPDMERALSLDDIASLGRQPWVLGVSPIVSSMTTAVRQGFDSSIILSGVSADYFSLQGIRFIQGNGFTRRDVEDREPVLVLDETSRETLFPGNEDPRVKLCRLPARRGG